MFTKLAIERGHHLVDFHAIFTDFPPVFGFSGKARASATSMAAVRRTTGEAAARAKERVPWWTKELPSGEISMVYGRLGLLVYGLWKILGDISIVNWV